LKSAVNCGRLPPQAEGKGVPLGGGTQCLVAFGGSMQLGGESARIGAEDGLVAWGRLWQEAVICVPMDRRLPLMRLRSRRLRDLLGQRFVVRLDEWPAGSAYPAAHLVRVLGPLNDLK
jgi:Dis3-like cold-shock domain 2 (CSD2)